MKVAIVIDHEKGVVGSRIVSSDVIDQKVMDYLQSEFPELIFDTVLLVDNIVAKLTDTELI